MTSEKVITSIRTKLSELDSVRNSTEFFNWNLSMVSKLEIICPNNSIVQSVKKINAVGWDYDNTPNAKEAAKTLLTGLIQDINDFGLEYLNPKQSIDKGLNLSVNQSNQQNQTTTVNINLEFIVDILKGELRTSEIEELKEILDSTDEPKVKKKNFIAKIKSFGSDVASNILANLLANPQVYEQLGQIL
jgi:hypothetical protein